MDIGLRNQVLLLVLHHDGVVLLRIGDRCLLHFGILICLEPTCSVVKYQFTFP